MEFVLVLIFLNLLPGMALCELKVTVLLSKTPGEGKAGIG